MNMSMGLLLKMLMEIILEILVDILSEMLMNILVEKLMDILLKISMVKNNLEKLPNQLSEEQSFRTRGDWGKNTRENIAPGRQGRESRCPFTHAGTTLV